MILQGFPNEISEEIVLPDMAELLQMPTFFDTRIEDVYKYGTDFQRMLLDKTPLRNTKKTISVLSQVRLLSPSYRSCTGVGRREQQFADEWHIDCEENENANGSHIYHESRDIVHLLSNDVSCLTEFNIHEQDIDWDYSRPLNEFIEHLFVNNLVEAKAMPANRIVTFTNHLHRAIDPKRIEFRYMWRVVETDRDREASPYDPNFISTVSGLEGVVPHLHRTDEKVTIFLPKNVDKSGLPKMRNHDEKLQDFIDFNNDQKFNAIKLTNCSWEGRDIAHLSIDFRKNSLIIYSKTNLVGEEGIEAFEHFAEGLELGKRFIRVLDEIVVGNSFNLHLKDPFIVDSEDADTKYIGFAIDFGEEAQYLDRNSKYSVQSIDGLFGLDTSEIVFKL